MPTLSFNTAYNAADTINSAIGVAQLVAWIIITIFFITVFWIFYFRKEVRLFLNRRRPVLVFTSDGNQMDAEISMIRQSKLFKIDQPTNDPRNCDRIKNHSLVVIGYTSKMHGFANILSAVRTAKIPIIVYTKVPLDVGDKQLLDGYSWHSVCNFPLKLMNDMFTILSTFPKMK